MKSITDKSRTSSQCREAVYRLKATLEGLSRVVIGRNDLLRQILFALVTKNHILVEGPPGVAKSYCANQLFSAITGARTFRVQCTRKMSEDYIVGPLDMRAFREEGVYRHLVEGSIVTANLAFVDEFLDLSPNTLRALLEILNERKFTRGVQKVKSSLWTAIACTNFKGDNDEALEAVMDRFLFKAKLTPLSSKENRKLMLLNRGGKVPTVSFRQVATIHKEVQRVAIPNHVLDVYLDICSGLKLTDRYIKKALDVVRANAVIEGRLVAKIADLSSLDCTFAVAGDSSSAVEWAKAFTSHYRPALAVEEQVANLRLISTRTHELKSMLEDIVEDGGSYDDVHAIACEAREASEVLKDFSSLHKSECYLRARQRIVSIYDTANTLYERQKY